MKPLTRRRSCTGLSAVTSRPQRIFFAGEISSQRPLPAFLPLSKTAQVIAPSGRIRIFVSEVTPFPSLYLFIPFS